MVIVWLSAAQAARRLGLRSKQVRRPAGVIPGVKAGAARNSPWRVTKQAVAGYLARKAS